MKKPKQPEATTPAEGFVWFKNFIRLRGGGYHFEWRIARVLDGQVEVYGPVLTLDPDDRYLHRAIWGPAISPPPTEDVAAALSLVPGRNRQQRKLREGDGPVPEKLLAVARRITLAFVGSSDDLRSLYADAPHKLEEVIQRVAGLIQAATA
jgi:hypothetical protein